MYALALAAVALAAPKPSVVVVLSIDQFRSDYITRFQDDFLPAKSGSKLGGFKWLMDNGARFVNARYRHCPTATGPGHSVIGTGSTPGISGIVANEWYDRTSGKSMYCVEDSSVTDVLTGKPSMSPKNQRVSTVVDELEMATNGKSITVSIAVKDRASILLAGHAADYVTWYDKGSGKWTTSTYYAKDGKLPDWIAKVNDKKIPDRWKGKNWELSQAPATYDDTFPTSRPGPPLGFGNTFPHTLGSDDAFYNRFTFTPFANEFVAETAASAIDSLGIGKDNVPDVITLNFSPNDYIGHAFGPYSPEVKEMTIGTDKAVSQLLNTLDEKVPGGISKVMFVLTADHGVAGVNADRSSRGIPAQLLDRAFFDKLKSDTEAKLGVQPIAQVDDGMLWLDRKMLAGAGISLEKAQTVVADLIGADSRIYRTYTGLSVAKLVPGDPIDEAYRRDFDPERGADVFFVAWPEVYQGGNSGTGHGTAWIYDRSVPMLFAGPGIEKGLHAEEVGPDDIAPTVAAALGIIPPSGCVGKAVGFQR